MKLYIAFIVAITCWPFVSLVLDLVLDERADEEVLLFVNLGATSAPLRVGRKVGYERACTLTVNGQSIEYKAFTLRDAQSLAHIAYGISK
jgi:hypothetical protein|tara:strand:- start:910 stop:1179 length:270 start_codon:yes stop_codon:yes gene_type:complete